MNPVLRSCLTIARAVVLAGVTYTLFQYSRAHAWAAIAETISLMTEPAEHGCETIADAAGAGAAEVHV